MNGWANHTPGEPWGDSREGLCRCVGRKSSREPTCECGKRSADDYHALDCPRNPAAVALGQALASDEEHPPA